MKCYHCNQLFKGTPSRPNLCPLCSKWVFPADKRPILEPPLDCSREAFCEFVKTLEMGERVIEAGVSAMIGETGTIVESRSVPGSKSVKWDTVFDEGSGMVTTITGGTRRFESVDESLAPGYRQVEPHAEAVLRNGEKIRPVATLEENYGAIAHIYADDGCYVLGLVQKAPPTLLLEGIEKITVPTHHIFPEAFEVFQRLPHPRVWQEQRDDDVCQECGRENAFSMDDIAENRCPRHWLAGQFEAQENCRNAAEGKEEVNA